jgi:C-terminal processing protease CtpA/Prc
MRIFALLLSVSLSIVSLLTSHCSASAADPQYSAADVRADFKQLYQMLQDSHADLYARRSKPQFDALYQQMRKGFDETMQLNDIRTAFQRFVAYGRVAHARIDEASTAYEQFRVSGGKAFPLHVRMQNGRAYVAINLSSNQQIAVGDELVTLDGKPLRTLLPLLGEYVSADNPYLRDTLMEHQFPRLIWQLWGAKQQFKLRIVKTDGSQRTVQVTAISRTQTEAALMQQPASFELSWDKREARMIDDKLAYLRPGPFYNNDAAANDPWDNRSFVRFIDDAFRSFRKAGAQRLLIDLRDNPGGDNSFSDAMVAWFATKPFKFCSAFRIKLSEAAIASNAKRLPDAPPDSISHRLAAAYAAHKIGDNFDFDMPIAMPRQGERFAGKVYMLINRHSYSNTVNVAALAQDYRFARILGEETSDLASTFGAMEQFSLVRTGIVVSFPKALIIRPSGDRKARGVIPDIEIQTPIVTSEKDVVLQRAVAWLQK